MFSPWHGESDKGEEGSQVCTLFRLPCHPAVFLAPSRGRSALDLRDLVEKTDWEGKGPTNTTGSLRMDLEWILELDG